MSRTTKVCFTNHDKVCAGVLRVDMGKLQMVHCVVLEAFQAALLGELVGLGFVRQVFL